MSFPRAERCVLGRMIAAAIHAGDKGAALALICTVLRRPDLGAEKILSHRYRFLWICNPKAASRSMIAALLAADPAALLIRDQSLEQVYGRHPEAQGFFSFAFLRHPVARIRSFHADKHTLARHDPSAYRWFIAPYHGLRIGMGLAEFCRWLETPCGADAFADRHWLSQWRQVTTASGRLPDFLGHHERLQEDWRTVTMALGLPPAALPRLNATRPATEPAVGGEAPLTATDVAILRRRYAKDFALGRYDDGP